MKRVKQNKAERLKAERVDALMLPDGTRLAWVPTWEGVLAYCPDDLKNDQRLRFWHVFRHKQLGRVRIELKGSLLCRNEKENFARPRMSFKFLHKGKLIRIQASILTMLCHMGFAIEDRRHWVVDHIDGNTLNDKPSNLQVISTRENIIRSLLFQETIRLSNAERKRRKDIARERMRKRRLQIMATLGEDATSRDVEFELALQIQEGTFDPYEGWNENENVNDNKNKQNNGKEIS